MLKKCPKNFQMSEQNWGCMDKMSEVNFSPAETLGTSWSVATVTLLLNNMVIVQIS